MLFTVTESPPRSHIQVKRGLIKNWPSPAAAAAACARFTQFLTNKSTRLSTFIRCYLCLYYGGKMCYFSVSRHANVSPFHGYIGLWKPLAAPLISRSPLVTQRLPSNRPCPSIHLGIFMAFIASFSHHDLRDGPSRRRRRRK